MADRNRRTARQEHHHTSATAEEPVGSRSERRLPTAAAALNPKAKAAHPMGATAAKYLPHLQQQTNEQETDHATANDRVSLTTAPTFQSAGIPNHAALSHMQLWNPLYAQYPQAATMHLTRHWLGMPTSYQALPYAISQQQAAATHALALSRLGSMGAPNAMASAAVLSQLHSQPAGVTQQIAGNTAAANNSVNDRVATATSTLQRSMLSGPNHEKSALQTQRAARMTESRTGDAAPPPADDPPMAEEDPLPPTEHGIYHDTLVRKRKWLKDCSVVTPLAPRTTGSANDRLRRSNAVNTNMATPSCSCKSSKCLQLLCECFAAIQFCGPRCKCSMRSCWNGNELSEDEAWWQRRNKYVLKALEEDPLDAFRSNVMEPACGNTACPCFQSGILCDPSVCDCLEGCHRFPNTRKRYFVDPHVDSDQPGMLTMSNANPLSYAIPLRIQNAIVPGLCFTYADPRHDSQTKQGEKNPLTKQKLYHNLMLSPSKTIRSTLSPTDAPPEGTEKERDWAKERRDLESFFHQVKILAEADSGDREDNATTTEIPVETQEVYKTILDDMDVVRSVVEAAKLNIMTVLYEQRKTSKYLCRSGAKRVADVEFESDRPEVEQATSEEIALRSDELLPPLTASQDDLPADPDASRQLLVRMVQETAMKRELARIIRRKAREIALTRARISHKLS